MITETPIHSKYEQVEQLLYRQIADGLVAPGQRMPSLADLCRQLRVSRDTVRHALNNLVRDGVLTVRPGYGYVVKHAERKLTVALWVSSGMMRLPTSSYQPLLFHALRTELRRRGCRTRVYLPVADDADERIDPKRVVRDIERNRFGALMTIGWPILHKHDEMDEQLQAMLTDNRLPWVGMADVQATRNVTVDYHAIGYLGAKELIRRGRTRIATIGTGHREPEFVRGCHEAMHEAGLTPDPDDRVQTPIASEAAGYQTFRDWWSERGGVQGVVVSDDVMAKGVMQAAIDAGACVPDDLMIASLSIQGGLECFYRPLIRLSIDPQLLAAQACDVLLAQTEDHQARPECIAVKPEVIFDQDPVQTLNDHMESIHAYL